jgi:hypothetical protein
MKLAILDRVRPLWRNDLWKRHLLWRKIMKHVDFWWRILGRGNFKCNGHKTLSSQPNLLKGNFDNQIEYGLLSKTRSGKKYILTDTYCSSCRDRQGMVRFLDYLVRYSLRSSAWYEVVYIVEKIALSALVDWMEWKYSLQ